MSVVFNDRRNRWEDEIRGDFLQFPFKVAVRPPERRVASEPTFLDDEQKEWLDANGHVEWSNYWLYQRHIYFREKEDAALFRLFFA